MNRAARAVPTVRTTRSLLGALLLALAMLATGCSSDPNSVGAQAQSGDRKGYIAGDGRITVIPANERTKPVILAGKTLDGNSWKIGDHRGRIVVVNLWSGWCAPCEAEAPDFTKVATEMKKANKPVSFIGINYRENPATGLAVSQKWGLPYPSITDEQGSTPVMMNGVLTVQPSTAILDRTGRVAAIATTAIDATILRGLIEDALAEKA